MKTSVLIQIMILPLLVVGCSAATTNNAGVAIRVSPLDPVVGGATSFSLSNAAVAQTVSWQVKDPSGNVLTACSGNQPTLHCTFPLGGVYTIALTGTDSAGNNLSISTSVTIIDPAAQGNQPPTMIADIYNASNSLVATFATDTALNSGSMNVPQGNYTLKFDRTTDDHDSLSALTFQVSINQGAFQTVSQDSTLSLPQVAVYNIVLKAIDTQSAASTVSFSAFIKCDTTHVTPLTLSSTNISIASEATRNLFDYSAVNVTGGIGPYKYSWDYNGDGVFDADWSTSATSTGIYSIYAGARTVGLKVWDTGCNLTASTTTSYNFNIHQANPAGGLAGLVDPNYYYIQGDVAPAAGNTNAALAAFQNATLSVNQLLTSPTPQRVNCTYVKNIDPNSNTLGSNLATFTITGLNLYSVSGAQNHGIELQVGNITDTNGLSASPTIDATAARVNYAYYLTDGNADTLAPIVYTNDQACTVNMQVINVGTPSGTCSINAGSSYAVQIEGTYQCPDLVNSADTLHVSLGETTGAFYCQVAHVTSCVGGGNATPGAPPVPR